MANSNVLIHVLAMLTCTIVYCQTLFSVDYASQAKGNEGLWYFVEYESQSDKTIFLVKYKNQADLLIHFVEYKSQAGWKNKSLMHLMISDES